jgi:DNA-binding transcriptional LysR family regulator
VRNEAFGVLHLTVYESMAATLLPSLLGALRRDHPGLEVRTSQRDPDLAAGEAVALVAVRDTLDEVVRGLRLEAPIRAA